MTALELLHEAERRGLTLKPAGRMLSVTPPRLLTSEFAKLLTIHKAALLAILTNTAPHRPLAQRELLLLQQAGMENDPIIFAALNIFNAEIVE